MLRRLALSFFALIIPFASSYASTKPIRLTAHSARVGFRNATSRSKNNVHVQPSLAHLSQLQLTPELNSKTLHLSVAVTGGNSANLRFLAIASDKGGVVCRREGKPNVAISLPIPHPHPWSPSDPYLYHLDVSLMENGKTIDRAQSYFAMRGVSCETDGKYPRIMLNGRFLFESGVMDQAVSAKIDTQDETSGRIRDELEAIKLLGFNLIRVQGKLEPERWYYWADKLGILVWQDAPPAPITGSKDEMTYENRLHRMILKLGNHPCIIMWTLFDKDDGRYDMKRLVRKVRDWDPSRLVDTVSGADDGLGDVVDVHCANRPIAPLPYDTRAVVVGKCGIVSGTAHNEATSDENIDGFAQNLARMIRMARYCGEKYGLSAVVFAHANRLLTKANLATYAKSIREANLGRINSNYDGNTVVPTSEEYPSLWYYSFVRGSGYWIQPDFNEDIWKRGFGGFGDGYPEADTSWTTNDIWIRRWVDIPDDTQTHMVFRVWHTGDAEIYVNGAEAAEVTGDSHGYVTVPMNMSGRYALRPGRDLIAVHCHQSSGRKFLDLGIVASRENKNKR